MKTFKIQDHLYVRDILGIVHQLDPKPFSYGEDYISCYDSPEYAKNNERLMKIRWDIVRAFTKGKDILDYGCGRGEFSKHAPKGYRCWNYDVGMTYEDRDYNVFTMWDVLEHIPDLDSFFIGHYPEYFVISVPWFPFSPYKISNWRHLKPNENLHHFEKHALLNLFNYYGYECVYADNPEDEIRKAPEGLNVNILTAVFKCR